MSTGAIIGGVVGAVIGFFIGGPIGAMWGAAIGMGIGMGLEAMNADIPSPGEPELGELTVNMAKEGALLPDILGSPKLNANILWAPKGSNIIEAIVEKMEGGKGGGGSEDVVTGYKHYLTWIVGICIGPVDKLFTIYSNDDVVWYGELDRPGSGGKETITLDGMGSADFYFGTDDHALNSYIGSRLTDSSLNIPYRNMCWMLLKNCYIGDYNRAPSMYFVIQKSPDISALTTADKDVEVYDYNPAHAIYYCLNTLGGLPTTWLHAGSFNDAAAVLKAEGRGLVIRFNRQASVQSYVESILQHIGGILRYSGDSKLHLYLWRDYEPATNFPEVDADSLLEEPSIERRSWIDTLSEVRVQHTNRFFRDLVCPSGCDGFEGDLSEIGDDELRTFTIKNPDWDELAGNCSDLSFLSDGLPASKAGTFSNLQKLGPGRWSFDYTSHATLCTAQHYDPEYCPIICGERIRCCECGEASAVSFDPNNPETIAPGSNITLDILGGRGPYSWMVSGTGFSLSYITTDLTWNRLSADGTGCGVAVVTVSDACGSQATAYIRATVGQWNEITFDSCVITGDPTEGDHLTRIEGKYKLYEEWMGFHSCDNVCYCTWIEAESDCSARTDVCHSIMGCTRCLNHDAPGYCSYYVPDLTPCQQTSVFFCCCEDSSCGPTTCYAICNRIGSKLYEWGC